MSSARVVAASLGGWKLEFESASRHEWMPPASDASFMQYVSSSVVTSASLSSSAAATEADQRGNELLSLSRVSSVSGAANSSSSGQSSSSSSVSDQIVADADSISALSRPEPVPVSILLLGARRSGKSALASRFAEPHEDSARSIAMACDLLDELPSSSSLSPSRRLSSLDGASLPASSSSSSSSLLQATVKHFGADDDEPLLHSGYRPTVGGIDYRLKILPWRHHMSVKVHLWDTSSDPDYVTFVDSYIPRADVIVISVDLSGQPNHIPLLHSTKDGGGGIGAPAKSRLQQQQQTRTQSQSGSSSNLRTNGGCCCSRIQADDSFTASSLSSAAAAAAAAAVPFRPFEIIRDVWVPRLEATLPPLSASQQQLLRRLQDQQTEQIDQMEVERMTNASSANQRRASSESDVSSAHHQNNASADSAAVFESSSTPLISTVVASEPLIVIVGTKADALVDPCCCHVCVSSTNPQQSLNSSSASTSASTVSGSCPTITTSSSSSCVSATQLAKLSKAGEKAALYVSFALGRPCVYREISTRAEVCLQEQQQQQTTQTSDVSSSELSLLNRQASSSSLSSSFDSDSSPSPSDQISSPNLSSSPRAVTSSNIQGLSIPASFSSPEPSSSFPSNSVTSSSDGDSAIFKSLISMRPFVRPISTLFSDALKYALHTRLRDGVLTQMRHHMGAPSEDELRRTFVTQTFDTIDAPPFQSQPPESVTWLSWQPPVPSSLPSPCLSSSNSSSLLNESSTSSSSTSIQPGPVARAQSTKLFLYTPAVGPLSGSMRGMTYFNLASFWTAPDSSFFSQLIGGDSDEENGNDSDNEGGFFGSASSDGVILNRNNTATLTRHPLPESVHPLALTAWLRKHGFTLQFAREESALVDALIASQLAHQRRQYQHQTHRQSAYRYDEVAAGVSGEGQAEENKNSSIPDSSGQMVVGRARQSRMDERPPYPASVAPFVPPSSTNQPNSPSASSASSLSPTHSNSASLPRSSTSSIPTSLQPRGLCDPAGRPILCEGWLKVRAGGALSFFFSAAASWNVRHAWLAGRTLRISETRLGMIETEIVLSTAFAAADNSGKDAKKRGSSEDRSLSSTPTNGRQPSAPVSPSSSGDDDSSASASSKSGENHVTLIRSVDCNGVQPERGFQLETSWRTHAFIAPSLMAARCWKACIELVLS